MRDDVQMRWSVVLALVIAWAPVRRAAAEHRHVMEPGETLEHVARAAGCTADALKRANHVDTVLVPAGHVVVVPQCSVRSRARMRRPRARDEAYERARIALEVIDGHPIASARLRRFSTRTVHERIPETSQSRGQPWHGHLVGGSAFPDGDGYWVRRPDKAFGATHVVKHVVQAIAEVRETYSDVHTLAIGDLSAPEGGPLGRHHSHQSGLDVDIGFYFLRPQPHYPEQFAPANGDLDLEATWALIEAFAHTAHEDGGVQYIFLDHAIQGRLYRWARSEGISADKLSEILQYPRPKDAMAGIVRHWPHHLDHMHVRFRPLTPALP